MKRSILVSIWFMLVPAFAMAESSFALSNGSRITFDESSGNFQVKTSDGKTRTYAPGSYGQLLKGNELSGESNQRRAQVAQFMVNTVSPAPEAPRPQVNLINLSHEQLAQVDRAMGASPAAAPASERQRVVMSASELADFLGPNGAKQVQYVGTGDRLQRLGGPPRPSDSGSGSDTIWYGYAGRMTSNRAGSKALAVGVEINHSYGFEYSCEDEGKQPSDANGPIRNINRICNMDALKYFPFTDKFEVYVGGGITRQGGHQGEPGMKYRVPEQWNGANLQAGAVAKVNRNVAIELRTRFAHYEQLNPNLPSKIVNGRFYRDGPYINNGHNPEDIGAKLLTSLGIRIQWGPGTRSSSNGVR